MDINRACAPYKQELARNLNVVHLTAFGMNYILPFGLATIFGLLAKESGKTVALPVLIAFVVMLLTANSYIYMVKRNPVAGSLYSYVDALLGRKMGFFAGWILFLDYILVPTVVSITAVNYLTHYFPESNWRVLLLIYVLATGLFNLFGIRLLANVGLILLGIAEVILVSCFVVFGNHVFASGQSLFSLEPFHFTSWNSLFVATILAVLGYLGYDAISTLAEEAKYPQRDLPRAILLSVVLSACTMFLLGYLGILSMPDLNIHFNDGHWVDNALFYVVYNSSGKVFGIIFASGVILSMVVFNIVSTAAGARLLYGMGRDRVLPRGIFAKINKRFRTPHNNIVIIMLVELVIGNLVTLDTVANVINFGAIVAFFILNGAVFYHIWQNNIARPWYLRGIKSLIPLLGAIAMLIMIVLMQKLTLIVGGIWAVLGIIYLSCNKYVKVSAAATNDEINYVENRYSNNSNVVICRAYEKQELVEELKICLEYEHWNTSSTFLDAMLEVNKDGFLLILRDNKLVGSVLVYNYDERYSFAGLYYIRSEYRGESLGAFLSGAALGVVGHRALACDALLMQVSIYERIGFQRMYENKRFVFTPRAIKAIGNTHGDIGKCIHLLDKCDFIAVADYDAKHFYTRREQLLKSWIDINKDLAFAYVNNIGQIEGLIIITKAPDSYRIGPFFADNVKIAEVLLYLATLNISGSLCSIDMPLVNQNAKSIVETFNMVESGMRSIRMHKGNMPVNNINEVYGHFAIEIG